MFNFINLYSDIEKKVQFIGKLTPTQELRKNHLLYTAATTFLPFADLNIFRYTCHKESHPQSPEQLPFTQEVSNLDSDALGKLNSLTGWANEEAYPIRGFYSALVVAKMHLFGKGTPRSPQQALSYLKRALAISVNSNNLYNVHLIWEYCQQINDAEVQHERLMLQANYTAYGCKLNNYSSAEESEAAIQAFKAALAQGNSEQLNQDLQAFLLTWLDKTTDTEVESLYNYLQRQNITLGKEAKNNFGARFLKLGNACDNQNSLSPQAKKYFTFAFDCDPTPLPQLYCHLASSYKEKKQYTAALECLNLSTQSGPTAMAWYELGRLHMDGSVTGSSEGLKAADCFIDAMNCALESRSSRQWFFISLVKLTELGKVWTLSAEQQLKLPKLNSYQTYFDAGFLSSNTAELYLMLTPHYPASSDCFITPNHPDKVIIFTKLISIYDKLTAQYSNDFEKLLTALRKAYAVATNENEKKDFRELLVTVIKQYTAKLANLTNKDLERVPYHMVETIPHFMVTKFLEASATCGIDDEQTLIEFYTKVTSVRQRNYFYDEISRVTPALQTPTIQALKKRVLADIYAQFAVGQPYETNRLAELVRILLTEISYISKSSAASIQQQLKYLDEYLGYHVNDVVKGKQTGKLEQMLIDIQSHCYTHTYSRLIQVLQKHSNKLTYLYERPDLEQQYIQGKLKQRAPKDQTELYKIYALAQQIREKRKPILGTISSARFFSDNALLLQLKAYADAGHSEACIKLAEFLPDTSNKFVVAELFFRAALYDSYEIYPTIALERMQQLKSITERTNQAAIIHFYYAMVLFIADHQRFVNESCLFFKGENVAAVAKIAIELCNDARINLSTDLKTALEAAIKIAQEPSAPPFTPQPTPPSTPRPSYDGLSFLREQPSGTSLNFSSALTAQASLYPPPLNLSALTNPEPTAPPQIGELHNLVIRLQAQLAEKESELAKATHENDELRVKNATLEAEKQAYETIIETQKELLEQPRVYASPGP